MKVTPELKIKRVLPYPSYYHSVNLYVLEGC